MIPLSDVKLNFKRILYTLQESIKVLKKKSVVQTLSVYFLHSQEGMFPATWGCPKKTLQSLREQCGTLTIWSSWLLRNIGNTGYHVKLKRLKQIPTAGGWYEQIPPIGS
ncbi:delta(24)-sterol reductase [Platysternon megacephalum]|uniref:Delta(24)-sterol reductase n=1 Tax=Platysternon megacephalum TaxID=55544 RepID=A0A4D9EHL6_9SAUR|nr:delta(24)-sterol reductase [Platysternon megacephalum]